MQQTLPPILKIKVTTSVAQRNNGIQTFCEKPSSNAMQKKEEPASAADGINACELFSLFTANIIKERRVFSR